MIIIKFIEPQHLKDKKQIANTYISVSICILLLKLIKKENINKICYLINCGSFFFFISYHFPLFHL